MLFLFFRPADSSVNLTIHDTPDFYIPSNQIGFCSFVRYDPQNSYVPLYSLTFDQLALDNNNIAIFKSAVHQIVTINNLKLKIFSCTNNSAQNILSDSESISCGNRKAIQQIHYLFTSLHSDLDGWKIGNFNIDSTNVSELLVNDFEYEYIKDGVIVLTIQSNRAIASYKCPGLALSSTFAVF